MKLNYTNIKIYRTYTFSEISKLLNIHLATVRSWKKKGLKVLDEESKPYLVEGADVKKFLVNKSLTRKCSLKMGEFYCVKCRTARRSIPSKIKYLYTHKQIGRNEKQVIIQGQCEFCGSLLNLFSTERKLYRLQNQLVFPRSNTKD